jgi:hypothetical protein
MEDGRSKIIIDRLIDMVENGQSVTFSSGKVAVNKDEAVKLLKELENLVSSELKVYREVNDRKGRIINEAKKEAEDIVYEAEQTASRIRVTKRMSGIGSGFRAGDLDDEEKMALRTAHDIYAASVIYTDEMLTEVTDVVAEAYDIINNQYGRMVSVLEEKARLIADNKAELMSGLRELSREDRYSQILELGQLLSNELYNEKNRRRDIEEEARQVEVQPEEDTAFAEAAAGYEREYVAAPENAGSDSALPTDNEVEKDGMFSTDYAPENENKLPADYEAENDSAFDVQGKDAIAADSAFDVQGNDAIVSDSAFVNAVSRETDGGKTAEEAAERKLRDVYVKSNVEKRILETREVSDVDDDGVKVLRPVNQFKGKKDPVANTLNMFKRNSANVRDTLRPKDGE